MDFLTCKLKLVENNSQISALIIEALKEEVDKALYQAGTKIDRILQTLLRKTIIEDETWQSLQNGKLKAEFGLSDDATQKLSEILEIWVSSITIEGKPATGTNTIRGGLKIGMVSGDWQDVITSAAASVTTNKGTILPWLEWLLLNGDKIIVREYEVLMKPTASSRSGMAIMINKKKGRWRVPPEYSGTMNNNFMTQILDRFYPIIEQVVEDSVNFT